MDSSNRFETPCTMLLQHGAILHNSACELFCVLLSLSKFVGFVGS